MQQVLVLVSLLVLVTGRLNEGNAREENQGVNNPINNNVKKQGLQFFPLIPGDSPEMERRRRARRHRHGRRELAAKKERNAQMEEEEEEDGDESPLELQRDILYEGYGTHYVDVWVGCGEPQRVTVIVDTGSSFTGFPCVGCHKCGGEDDAEYHTDHYYNPDQSTCFEEVESADDCWLGHWKKDDKTNGTCRASAHYSEGSSWTAYEATDRVYTGGDHNRVDVDREEHDSFSLHFGCQDKVTGLFETQLADGIMGMKVDKTSFWNQMYKAGKMEQAAFSLCFSKPAHVERSGSLAGAMVLGGTDTRLHKTEMVYAKQMAHDGKYVVHLEKVYLQDAETGELSNVQIFEEDLNNRGQVIVDSGTTGTYLSRKLESHFVSAWNDMVPKDVMQIGRQNTYTLTKKQLQSLPTVVFQMTAWDPKDHNKEEEDAPETTTVPGIVGKDLDKRHAGKSILVAMPPSQYLTPDRDNQYYLDISFREGSGRGGVLGANFMRGQDVLFDIDNDRIGFAQSDCKYNAIADDEEAN